MSEYVAFEVDEAVSATRKTKVVRVVATRDGHLLGTIGWFGRWRQYAFFPRPWTVFNPDCLLAIKNQVELLTLEHRNRRRAR